MSYGLNGTSFLASKPQVWSPGRFMLRQGLSSYDLHPDGNRFALVSPQAAPTNQDKVIFVFNFFDQLRQRVPAGK